MNSDVKLYEQNMCAKYFAKYYIRIPNITHNHDIGRSLRLTAEVSDMASN